MKSVTRKSKNQEGSEDIVVEGGLGVVNEEEEHGVINEDDNIHHHTDNHLPSYSLFNVLSPVINPQSIVQGIEFIMS